MKQVVCQLCKCNLASAAVHDKIRIWPKLKDPGVLLSTRRSCFIANIPAPCWGEHQRHPHFCPFLDSALHRGKPEYGVEWDHHVLTQPRSWGEMTSEISLNAGLVCIYIYIYEQS